MFGVGGAVISTPGIRALGATAFVAVGSTLPSIIPSAASGTLRYARERMIDWRVVTWTAGAGIAATVGGSRLSHIVPGGGPWLMILPPALLRPTAGRNAPVPAPAAVPASVSDAEADGAVDVAVSPVPPEPRPRRTDPLTLGTIGVVAGGLSGLLGIGGGIVMVPAFTEWVGLPLKEAIATS